MGLKVGGGGGGHKHTIAPPPPQSNQYIYIYIYIYIVCVCVCVCACACAYVPSVSSCPNVCIDHYVLHRFVCFFKSIILIAICGSSNFRT